MTRRLRAVLLDALGTLLELEPPAPALAHEFAARFEVELSQIQAGAAIQAEISYYRAHLMEGRDADSLADLRARCAAVLRAALPADERITRIPADDLTDLLLTCLRFRPFPEVPDALRELRAQGLVLVVASNWDFSLHEVLGRVGLLELVDGVVTSAEVGSRKPAGGVFRQALERAHAAAGETLHVGDSPDEDVAGACAAGIRAVLVWRSDDLSPPQGVRTVSDLSELPRITSGG